MNQIPIPTALDVASGKLSTMLLEYRGTHVFERVKLYVARFSGGKKLSEYLADPEAKEDDKLRILTTLTAIVSTRDWSRLPELEAEPAKEANGEAHPNIHSFSSEDYPGNVSLAQIKAIARQEARAELADVLEKVAKVLRETT